MIKFKDNGFRWPIVLFASLGVLAYGIVGAFIGGFLGAILTQIKIE